MSESTHRGETSQSPTRAIDTRSKSLPLDLTELPMPKFDWAEPIDIPNFQGG
jgi:hypothetical protein